MSGFPTLARLALSAALLLVALAPGQARSIADGLYFDRHQWDDPWHDGEWNHDPDFWGPYDGYEPYEPTPWYPDHGPDDVWFPPDWDYPHWPNPHPDPQDGLALVFTQSAARPAYRWSQRGQVTLEWNLRRIVREGYARAVQSGEVPEHRSAPISNQSVSFLVAVPVEGLELFRDRRIGRGFLVLAVEGEFQPIYYMNLHSGSPSHSSFRWDPNNRSGTWSFQASLMGFGHHGDRQDFHLLCGFDWGQARLRNDVVEIGSLPLLETVHRSRSRGVLENLRGRSGQPRALLTLSRGGWSSVFRADGYSHLEIRDGAHGNSQAEVIELVQGSSGHGDWDWRRWDQGDRVTGVHVADGLSPDQDSSSWRDSDGYDPYDFDLGFQLRDRRSRDRDFHWGPRRTAVEGIRFTHLDVYISDGWRAPQDEVPSFDGLFR